MNLVLEIKVYSKILTTHKIYNVLCLRLTTLVIL
nr:MAG TPA: hypothetical protein [Caudoviricetes sp.]